MVLTYTVYNFYFTFMHLTNQTNKHPGLSVQWPIEDQLILHTQQVET